MTAKTENLARRGKPLAFAGAFFLVAAGRWYNLQVLHHEPFRYALPWAAVYGAAAGFVFYHMVDLFLARGLLPVKIARIRIPAVYLSVVIIVNRFLLPEELHHSTAVILIETLLTLILGTGSVILDIKLSGRPVYAPASPTPLPKRYLRRRVVRTFFESLFRLFPRPEPVGLYSLGDADENSMVVVTGNYDLTIRRVARALRGIPCRLLVCDSRGINIWCSSLANHFNTDKIISAVNETGLADVVKHRRLILPQLCAANVSCEDIRRKTGFSCDFGPVRITDLEEYLVHPENKDIRLVVFPLRSRLEMAIGTIFLPAVFTVFLFNFINPDMLFVLLPSFCILSLVNALIFPRRPVKNVRWWSLVYALVTFLLAWILCALVLKVPGLPWAVTLGVAGLYFVNEFEGWSPLVKFSFTGAHTHARIDISTGKCTGCGRCVDVCPKGVYSIRGGKSVVTDVDACISCKSCFVQCPAGAIHHSAESINESLA